MRVLLVANPAATTAGRGVPRRVRDVLAGVPDVEAVDLVMTEHRGHARELAAAAAGAGTDVVVALGGDGTVSEVVNGLLDADPGAVDPSVAAGADPRGPVLAVVPAGATNVLARALGLARRPLAAAAEVATALHARSERRIGLGLLEPLDGDDGPRRWFVLNVGVGLDAAAVAHVEQARVTGRRASGAVYAFATYRAWRASDRTDAPLRVRTSDGGVDALAAVMVTNTDPWTFFGPRRMRPTPRSSFDLGLDVMGARDLDLGSTLGGIGRMLAHRPAPLSTAWQAHDEPWLEVRSSRPLALQADGEYLGQVSGVRLTARPTALRLAVPRGLVRPAGDAPRSDAETDPVPRCRPFG